MAGDPTVAEVRAMVASVRPMYLACASGRPGVYLSLELVDDHVEVMIVRRDREGPDHVVDVVLEGAILPKDSAIASYLWWDAATDKMVAAENAEAAAWDPVALGC